MKKSSFGIGTLSAHTVNYSPEKVFEEVFTTMVFTECDVEKEWSSGPHTQAIDLLL